MFEIVQNLVQEFKTVKQECGSMPVQTSCPMSMCREFVSSDFMRNVCDDEDDEAEEDEDDEDDEDEDEDEDEDDDEDDDEDERDVKIINMSESAIEEIIELEPEAPIVIEETVDYKKQTVAELRTIVTSRGLATNPSRLSKTELLKLLEK